MEPRRFTGPEVALVALLGAGVGYFGARAGADERPAPRPAPVASIAPPPPPRDLASSAPVAPSPPSSASALSDLELARRGDLGALKRLERTPQRERSLEGALALEAGHAEQARVEARVLVEDLRADPGLFADASTSRHARSLAADPSVAPVLLAGLAELAHPAAADLIHDVASRADPGSRLALFALDLLEGPLLRPKQSPALRVVTDLAAATDCWKRGEVLSRAASSADERALVALSALAKTSGCGPKQLDDCNPCLRAAPYQGLVDQALERARASPFEAPWSPQRGSAQQRKPVE